MAEGTIYNYFGSKHDLLVGIMAQLAESEHLGEQLAQAADADARAFLTSLLRIRQEFASRNEAILRVTVAKCVGDFLLRQDMPIFELIPELKFCLSGVLNQGVLLPRTRWNRVSSCSFSRKEG